jgi:hypothetical protein
LRTEQDIHEQIFASNRQYKTPGPNVFDWRRMSGYTWNWPVKF